MCSFSGMYTYPGSFGCRIADVLLVHGPCPLSSRPCDPACLPLSRARMGRHPASSHLRRRDPSPRWRGARTRGRVKMRVPCLLLVVELVSSISRRRTILRNCGSGRWAAKISRQQRLADCRLQLRHHSFTHLVHQLDSTTYFGLALGTILIA
jgi:hypothetical protein